MFETAQASRQLEAFAAERPGDADLVRAFLADFDPNSGDGTRKATTPLGELFRYRIGSTIRVLIAIDGDGHPTFTGLVTRPS